MQLMDAHVDQAPGGGMSRGFATGGDGFVRRSGDARDQDQDADSEEHAQRI